MEKERSFLRERWLWIIFLAYLALAAFSFNRGLFLSDEGYQLYYSWLITKGQKIYKDFFLTVAPFAYLVQALLIKIFGVKLIFSRIYAALIGIAGFFAIAYISKKVVPGKYWLLSAGLYIIFSNNLFNYSQHCVMGKYFFIFSLALALYWFDSGRLLALFGSGLFAGMASFSYQSLVAVAGAQLVLCLWFRDREKIRGWFKPAMVYCAGFLIIAVIVFAYLAHERLLEEAFQLTVLGNRKQHVFQALLKFIFPGFLVVAFLGAAPFWFQRKKSHLPLASISQAIFIALLAANLVLVLVDFSFSTNVLSWMIPVALFAMVMGQLMQEKASDRQIATFLICAIFFVVGVLGGYDIGHNLSSALLLTPWIGFLAERLFKSNPRQILVESAALPLLLIILIVGLATMVVWRWELWGEVEPLYRCNSRLEMESAKGIYTSREQKQDLETLVSYIQKNTQPGDRILVYPNQLLIYFLTERTSLSKAPFFYYETTNLQELEKAAELARQNKSPVIFQIKDGQIFQPLASQKADEIINNLSGSCAEKIKLKNYLVCKL